MKKTDGGPAFPRPASEYTKNGTCPDGNEAIDWAPGMSLRDWFAGMALQGIMAGKEFRPKLGPDELAIVCYETADAMLAERNRG